MTEPAPREFEALRNAVQEGRAFDDPYGPGNYVLWFLSQHMKAEDILFVDVLPDRAKTVYESRTGRLFIVTATDVVIVEYRDAVETAPSDPGETFGSASIVFHPKTPHYPAVLAWAGRDLRVPPRRHVAQGVTPGVKAGAIHAEGNGWSIKLPSEDRRSGGDEYFARLRRALTMYPSNLRGT